MCLCNIKTTICRDDRRNKKIIDFVFVCVISKGVLIVKSGHFFFVLDLTRMSACVMRQCPRRHCETLCVSQGALYMDLREFGRIINYFHCVRPNKEQYIPCNN